MEILQTIWNALTTENKQLADIILYFLGFVEVILTMLLFTSLLNITSSRKTRISYVITFTVISILTNIFIPAPYNSFINVLICPLLVFLFFKTKIFTAILSELIPYTIFVFIGAISLNLHMHLLGLSSNLIIAVPIYRISSVLFTYFAVYFTYHILKHYNVTILLLERINLKNYKTLIINLVIGVLAVGFQSYVATFYSDVLPFRIIALNLFTLLLYFIFSLYSLTRTSKLEVAQRDLEQSKQYINTLTILHDSIRCFKHDFNNIVSTIGRLYSSR